MRRALLVKRSMIGKSQVMQGAESFFFEIGCGLVASKNLPRLLKGEDVDGHMTPRWLYPGSQSPLKNCPVEVLIVNPY